ASAIWPGPVIRAPRLDDEPPQPGLPGPPEVSPEKRTEKLLAGGGARTPTYVTAASPHTSHPAAAASREEINDEHARPGVRCRGQCADRRDSDRSAAVARTRRACIPGRNGRRVCPCHGH